jgi:hypothetical protein
MDQLKNPENGHLIWLIDETCFSKECYKEDKCVCCDRPAFCRTWSDGKCKPYIEEHVKVKKLILGRELLLENQRRYDNN